jgi:hypothetical protein
MGEGGLKTALETIREEVKARFEAQKRVLGTPATQPGTSKTAWTPSARTRSSGRRGTSNAGSSSTSSSASTAADIKPS